jgi:RNA polymerase sigma factor (sigma-70 family)
MLGGCRSDEQLVARVRAGHHGAFEVLAARYQGRLLGFCRKMLSSTQDAEDALQDVLVAAYNAIRADEREIQVRPWLYRIARNRCLDQLRCAARIAADSLDDQGAQSPGSLAETVAMRQELREVLGDVQALPARQRTALTLYELDDFSYRQIAVAMSTTVQGVKSLLIRARIHLLDAALARDRTHAFAGPQRHADARPRRRASTTKPLALGSARAGE